MKRKLIFSSMTLTCLSSVWAAPLPYLNPDIPVEERVQDLISRLTLNEKLAQLTDQAPSIYRGELDIPGYGWWNEGLHGVARNGLATVFPQAIALAATWDTHLMKEVASTIGDEARIKFNIARSINYDTTRYEGLTLFSPNINIFRDPRWGRGHETYGEDPYLTGKLAVEFIAGLQGDDPKYLKTAATAKHFAVHSGPEAERHSFDAKVSLHDLYDTYLPQFEMAVKDGKVAAVMTAYNRINGAPASVNAYLLQDILKRKWGFEGFIVTDCWAIQDIYQGHGYLPSQAAASATAIKTGVNLECGDAFKTGLSQAIKQKLITEEDINKALSKLLTVRFKLGMFDPPEKVPYNTIPTNELDSQTHRQLARQAAQESIVLLKNQSHLLPLKQDIKTIAVIGPVATEESVLLGNYHGTPSTSTTLLEGLTEATQKRGMAMTYATGSPIVGDATQRQLDEATLAAQKAEVIILTLGITPHQEGEENESQDNPGGDRKDLQLPIGQQKLLKAMISLKKPTVLVLTGGSALAIQEAKQNINAILMSWYSGEEGGHAISDVLFGVANPAGRLPITFYASEKDLPPFDDYRMAGRTYRYFKGETLWSFGFGLSYSTYQYSHLNVEETSKDQNWEVNIKITNTSHLQGDEVVQVYIEPETHQEGQPIRWLAGFQRIALQPQETKTVQFSLGNRELGTVNAHGERIIIPGNYKISVGNMQPTEPQFQGLQQTVTLY